MGWLGKKLETGSNVEKTMKENRTEWTDQVEAGSDQSFGEGDRTVSLLFWNTGLYPAFSVEFIPFHKGSITPCVKLPKWIQWVLCVYTALYNKNSDQFSPRSLKLNNQNYMLKISGYKIRIILTLTYFSV